MCNNTVLYKPINFKQCLDFEFFEFFFSLRNYSLIGLFINDIM